METFLCWVYFQTWTLLECLAQIFCHFTKTRVEESIDFALLKNRQTKKFLKDSCLFQKRRALLKSRMKVTQFYLCGNSLDVYELETSVFADWIDVVADALPRCQSWVCSSPVNFWTEIFLWLHSQAAAGCVGFGHLNWIEVDCSSHALLLVAPVGSSWEAGGSYLTHVQRKQGLNRQEIFKK